MLTMRSGGFPMIKFKGELWAACIAVVTAASGTALAQSTDDPNAVPPDQNQTTPATTDVAPAPQPAQQPPAPAPTTVIVQPTTYRSDSSGMARMERVGFSLSAGGGVTDFTNQEMRDTTGTGGSW